MTLTITKQQLSAFSEGQRRTFVKRVAAHVREFFPEHAKALDETQLDALIDYGIERGAAHNIVAERDVCKLVDLMVGFGPMFESDPKHRWAARILGERAGKDPSEVVDALYDAGLAELDAKAKRQGLFS